MPNCLGATSIDFTPDETFYVHHLPKQPRATGASFDLQGNWLSLVSRGLLRSHRPFWIMRVQWKSVGSHQWSKRSFLSGFVVDTMPADGLTLHYNDVIMGAIVSQITNLTIVYSIVYSDADQRKHQSSASLAFVRGIHRWPVNSPHKGPVTRKMFPFDDIIMVALGTWTSGASFSNIDEQNQHRDYHDHVMDKPIRYA